jgi:hypothetical protein
VELALGLAVAIGTIRGTLAAIRTLAAVGTLRDALLGQSLAMRFGSIGGPALRRLVVAALAGAVLRAGATMALLAAIVRLGMAAISLSVGPRTPLGLSLGDWLQALERLGRGHEIGGQLCDRDLLASGPL